MKCGGWRSSLSEKHIGRLLQPYGLRKDGIAASLQAEGATNRFLSRYARGPTAGRNDHILLYLNLNARINKRLLSHYLYVE
jgi:hypothetical protein